MPYKNPFADMFANFPGSCSFNSDAFNFDKFVEAGRLNAKAFAEASKAASAGAQAVCRIQVENAQKAAEEFARYSKDASNFAKNPEAAFAKQAEFANASFKSAAANINELYEVAVKSGSEAAGIIEKRVSSALSEFASANTNSNAASPIRKNKSEAA